MTCPFNKESLAQLKTFISLCQSQPELLHAADLTFFREYIESFGGKIPQRQREHAEHGHEHVPEPRPPTPEPNEDVDLLESDPESDVELNSDGCVEPDVLDDSQVMGDDEKEPTEEECDKADEVKREAMAALNDGDNVQAVELFTQAIEINPKLAILFTKRGQAYLRLNKPNACIKDCTRALELNCDSAPGYKFRGRAYRLIGKWEEAAKDLRQACKIDFDEQADEWLKEVQPNAIRIEQHKVKQDRRIADKQEKEMTDRIRKAREAHANAARAGQDEAKHSGGMPGGFPDILSFWQDPEIVAALKDPEVAAAFKDISSNPANMSKYENNPKVQALLSKLAQKFEGSGGLPGFTMGGGSGPAGAAGTGASSTGFSPADDGLD